MTRSALTSAHHPRGIGKDAEALDLIESAMVDWPIWVDHVLPFDQQAGQCDRVAREAAGVAERAVRLLAYLEARSTGKSHQQAVSAQNKAATKTRRCIGYSYPKQDVIF